MRKKLTLLFCALVIIGGLVIFFVNKNNLVPQNDLVSGGDYTHIFHEEAEVNEITDSETITVTIDQTADTAEYFKGKQLVLHCPDGFSNIQVNDRIVFYFFLDNVDDDTVKVERIKTIE